MKLNDTEEAFAVQYSCNGYIVDACQSKRSVIMEVAKVVIPNQTVYWGQIVYNSYEQISFNGTIQLISNSSLKSYQFFNGWQCIGQFNDSGNGIGTMISFDDQTIKKGNFVDGKLKGVGSICCAGQETKGIFYDDKLCEGDIDANGSGVGVMYEISGDLKSGQFQNGSLINGQHYRACGQIYDGEFINDKFVKGTIHYSNGREIVIE